MKKITEFTRTFKRHVRRRKDKRRSKLELKISDDSGVITIIMKEVCAKKRREKL